VHHKLCHAVLVKKITNKKALEVKKEVDRLMRKATDLNAESQRLHEDAKDTYSKIIELRGKIKAIKAANRKGPGKLAAPGHEQAKS
jgi:uncharacterized coiled-coil DUF342 family protein